MAKVNAKYEITAEDNTKAGIASAKRGMQDLQGNVNLLRNALVSLGGAFAVKAIIDNLSSTSHALAQLDAAIKSTNGAMGYTRKELVAMAEEMQKTSTFGATSIMEAQARLVTYTGIVGTNFPRALKAAIDQSARLNISLTQSAETIGKALESPLKAVTTLTKQGFGAAFTEEIKATIYALVQAGKEAEAQALILGIVESAYGDAAKAARNNFGGALTGLKNQLSSVISADDGSLEEARLAIEGITTALQDPQIKQAINDLITGFIKISVFGVDAADGVSRAFSAVGKTMGAAAAQLVAIMQGEFRQAMAIGDEWLRDMNSLLERPMLSSIVERATKTANTAIASGGGAAGSGNGVSLALPSIDVTRALLDRQTALVKDAISRQQTALDNAYKDGLKSTAEYFQQRAQLQQASLDAELESLRGQLAEAKREEAKAAAASAASDSEAASAASGIKRAREQQIQILGKITIAERERGQVAVQAARDQAEAEKELASQLERVHIRLLELTGETARARNMAIESEYRALLARLGADSDTAGAAMVRRLINVEEARAALDELQQTWDLAMQRLATSEQALDLQRSTGMLTEAQARRQLIDLHKQTAAEVESLIPKMRELAAATGDPAAIARVDQLALRLQELGATADDVALRINGAVETGFGDMLADLATGAATAEEAFRKFASTVVSELARIAASELAGSIFGGMGSGGLGGWVSGLLRHQGGLAGMDGTTMRIPKLIFTGAPRYHGGGIAGLKPDEIPAILRRGEEVLTQDDPRHRNNGNVQSGPTELGLSVTVVDKRANLADSLASAEGQSALVMAIERNSTTIKHRLGLR